MNPLALLTTTAAAVGIMMVPSCSLLDSYDTDAAQDDIMMTFVTLTDLNASAESKRTLVDGETTWDAYDYTLQIKNEACTDGLRVSIDDLETQRGATATARVSVGCGDSPPNSYDEPLSFMNKDGWKLTEGSFKRFTVLIANAA